MYNVWIWLLLLSLPSISVFLLKIFSFLFQVIFHHQSSIQALFNRLPSSHQLHPYLSVKSNISTYFYLPWCQLRPSKVLLDVTCALWMSISQWNVRIGLHSSGMSHRQAQKCAFETSLANWYYETHIEGYVWHMECLLA